MLHWHGRFPARSNSRPGYPAVKGPVKTVVPRAPDSAQLCPGSFLTGYPFPATRA